MSIKNRLSIKGLDKIFGDGINDVIRDIENDDTTKETAIKIPLDQIRANPYQPRKVFNDDELKGLALSIREHGLIQPIIVKKSVNGYNIVAGERRTRAARIAGLKEIPAIIVDFTDAQMKEIALIENIQRVDLTPIEEAIAFKDLCDTLNLTQENLAVRLGKSRSHIANTMRLLQLPPRVQELVLNKTLTMGQVKPLITINNHQKIIEFAEQIAEKQLNARQAEELVKKYEDRKTKYESFPDEERIANEFLENQMMRQLGTKVAIDSNKISISYSSVRDLNRILEILGFIEKDDF